MTTYKHGSDAFSALERKRIHMESVICPNDENDKYCNRECSLFKFGNVEFRGYPTYEYVVIPPSCGYEGV